MLNIGVLSINLMIKQLLQEALKEVLRDRHSFMTFKYLPGHFLQKFTKI